MLLWPGSSHQVMCIEYSLSFISQYMCIVDALFPVGQPLVNVMELWHILRDPHMIQLGNWMYYTFHIMSHQRKANISCGIILCLLNICWIVWCPKWLSGNIFKFPVIFDPATSIVTSPKDKLLSIYSPGSIIIIIVSFAKYFPSLWTLSCWVQFTIPFFDCMSFRPLVHYHKWVILCELIHAL